MSLLTLIASHPDPSTLEHISHVYDELVSEIIDHNRRYYIDHQPIISDTEWDTLFAYLKQIEDPHLIRDDSPTQSLV